MAQVRAQPKPLEDALRRGLTSRTVRHLLEDAGSELDEQKVFRLRDEEVKGTALAMAAALSRKEVVRELLEAGADVNDATAFSWTGGLFATSWEGPVAFAAVLACRVDVLALLVEFKAELGGHQALIKGEPRGTLLYEACLQSGGATVVDFLVKHGVDVHEVVTHPADPDLKLTALHCASRRGAPAAASILIAAGADLNQRGHSDANVPSTPLGLAIENGNFDMVQILIASSADLWATSHGEMSNIDNLFEKGNVVSINAAAMGLQQVDPKQLRLETNHLVNFLMTSGDASFSILQALFRLRKIKIWAAARSLDLKTAHVNSGTDCLDSMNTAAGPDSSFLDAQYTAAQLSERKLDRGFSQSISPKEQQFLDTLLPQKSQNEKSEQMPVECLQCIMPGLHAQPEVLYALANCPGEKLFDDTGCQAIVNLAFLDTCDLYWAEQVMHFLQTCIFFGASVALNDGAPADDRWSWVVPMTVLWICAVSSEILQLVGMAMIGRWRSYFNLNNTRDFLDLNLTLFSIIVLALRWETMREPSESVGLRFAVAILACFRWLKVLFGLRVNARVGPRMLPILQAAEDCLPFITVVVIPLLGLTHFYYLLGANSETASHLQARSYFTDLFFMYEMLLGGYDMDVLGGPIDDFGFLSTILKLFVVLVTFIMSTVMMNIFIGVLSESYASANSERDRLFIRQKAQAAFNYSVRYHAIHSLCPSRHRKVHSEEKLEVERWDYPWYCKQSSKVPDLHFIDDDAQMTPGQRRILAELVAAQKEQKQQAEQVEQLTTLVQHMATKLGVVEEVSPVKAPVPMQKSKMSRNEQRRDTVEDLLDSLETSLPSAVR
mmetsp:Transcript_24415/g.44247  ORF Transcript_24415/g.44247 Transcript_24415/m.44247 type:complete len:836 (+) Transcript_24415:47-2554(+)